MKYVIAAHTTTEFFEAASKLRGQGEQINANNVYMIDLDHDSINSESIKTATGSDKVKGIKLYSYVDNILERLSTNE